MLVISVKFYVVCCALMAHLHILGSDPVKTRTLTSNDAVNIQSVTDSECDDSLRV